MSKVVEFFRADIENARLRREIEALREKLQQREERIRELKAEIERLTNEVLRLEAEKRALESREDQERERLARQVTNLMDEKRRLTERLELREGELRRSREGAKKLEEENRRLKGEIEELKGRLKSSEEENSKLKAQIEELKSIVPEYVEDGKVKVLKVPPRVRDIILDLVRNRGWTEYKVDARKWLAENLKESVHVSQYWTELRPTGEMAAHYAEVEAPDRLLTVDLEGQTVGILATDVGLVMGPPGKVIEPGEAVRSYGGRIELNEAMRKTLVTVLARYFNYHAEQHKLTIFIFELAPLLAALGIEPKAPLAVWTLRGDPESNVVIRTVDEAYLILKGAQASPKGTLGINGIYLNVGAAYQALARAAEVLIPELMRRYPEVYIEAMANVEKKPPRSLTRTDIMEAFEQGGVGEESEGGEG